MPGNNKVADQTADALTGQLLCCSHATKSKFYSRRGPHSYPHAFLKKRRGYCNRLRPSVRPSVRLSVRLSVRPSVCPSRYLLLNRWTKFNQIWCVSCSHGKGVQRHIFFWPRPLGPWGGAKRSNIIKYHLISITKSISKIFKPNFVCLLTNERYKTYQTGFSFPCLGHAPGVGLGGTVGG